MFSPIKKLFIINFCGEAWSMFTNMILLPEIFFFITPVMYCLLIGTYTWTLKSMHRQLVNEERKKKKWWITGLMNAFRQLIDFPLCLMWVDCCCCCLWIKNINDVKQLRNDNVYAWACRNENLLVLEVFGIGARFLIHSKTEKFASFEAENFATAKKIICVSGCKFLRLLMQIFCFF